MKRRCRENHLRRSMCLFVVLSSLLLFDPYPQAAVVAAQQEVETLKLPYQLRATYLPAVYAMQNSKVASCVAATGESENVADAITVCAGQVVSGSVSQQDTDDVYRISLKKGEKLTVRLDGNVPDVDVFIYPPGTTDVVDRNRDQYVSVSNGRDSDEHLSIVIDQTGLWYIDVYAFKGTITYSLTIAVE